MERQGSPYQTVIVVLINLASRCLASKLGVAVLLGPLVQLVIRAFGPLTSALEGRKSTGGFARVSRPRNLEWT